MADGKRAYEDEEGAIADCFSLKFTTVIVYK